MKIIISPAKTVSKKIESLNNKENFSKKTYEILERVPQVRLSNELFKAFYMYDGLCFKNMNREDLDSKDLDYIDKHLFILSALYGAVRPFDLISPYRLDFLMKTEMGNLYKFWQDEIAKKVLEDEDLIVNLASDEFSKTIKKHIKDEKILNIEFFENVDGNLKKHSTISKKFLSIYLSSSAFLSIQIKSPTSVPSSSQIFHITDNETASPLTILDIVVGDIPVLSIKSFFFMFLSIKTFQSPL